MQEKKTSRESEEDVIEHCMPEPAAIIIQEGVVCTTRTMRSNTMAIGKTKEGFEPRWSSPRMYADVRHLHA